jgi:class 3 adenylate cyclase
MKKALMLIFLLLLSTAKLWAQVSSGLTQGRAKFLLNKLEQQQFKDSQQEITVCDSLIKYFKSKNQTCKELYAQLYAGVAHDKAGNFKKATEILQLNLDRAEDHCDPLLVSKFTIALSNLYLSLEDFVRVDTMTSNILKDAKSRSWPSKQRAGLKMTQGIALASMGNLDDAMIAFRELHEIGKKSKEQMDTELGLLNMATIHAIKGEFQQAIGMYKEVLISTRKNPISDHLFRAWQNLGALYGDLKQPETALKYIDSARAYAKKSGDLSSETDALNSLARIHENKGDFKNAYQAIIQSRQLGDSLLNKEKIRAVADVREKYETEKKAKENILLKNLQLQMELDRASVIRTRNLILFIGLAILGASLALWGRLRIVARSRKAIRKEKDINEKLLLNILPAEVAVELKEKGQADARLFDEVSVLFTDFKGFTQLSEKVSAKELVKNLNDCFVAFDKICEKYHIEKIKTIGDAYMAAGGLPTPALDHAERVVNAALEMATVVEETKNKKIEAGELFFEIRIGVHSGPVVAGIVGIKKFQYDIWGDTVNTASRMESSGAIGQVNISNDTYELIKNISTYQFESRGKISAKGKGELEMWFVKNSGQ